MSSKRQNTSSPEAEEDDRHAKRSRPPWIDDFDTFEHATARERPRVDVSSGQQSAFPGLEDDNDELIYGDPEDGLQYLRMVRSERKTVPHILVADRETMTVQDGEDYNGQDYHPDRAWIAAPQDGMSELVDDSPDAQDLYYLAVLDRFTQLQTRLRIPPPLSSLELLTSSQPISFPPDAAKAREKWRHVTKTSDPVPTQLACMDPESVMELVKLLTEGMSGIVKSRVQEKIKRLGGWIWAGLARCRDRGELSSEEIAELRDLGKRSVQLLDFVRRVQGTRIDEDAGICSCVASDLSETVQAEDEVGPHANPVDPGTQLEAFDDDQRRLEQAKAHINSLLEAADQEGAAPTAVEGRVAAEEMISKIDVDQQIHMVLDTTITIVGEVYGQRDLLEHRDIWD